MKKRRIALRDAGALIIDIANNLLQKCNVDNNDMKMEVGINRE
jgi:hypothetical protein